MKKILVVLLIMILCCGCSAEEVVPVVSNVDVQVGVVTTDASNEYGDLGFVDYDTVEYKITFAPYKLKSNQEENARIIVWQNAALKNDYFRKTLGIAFTGNFYKESEMPLQSRKEITISIHDVYHDGGDIITRAHLEGYISTIHEVKYTIYVGNRKIETNTIRINE